jgi:hypothetical protein
MAESKKGIYAVGVVASAALAVSVASFVRDHRPPPAPAATAASACADPDARAAVEQLRREVALLTAALATRSAPSAPPGGMGGTPPGGGGAPRSNVPVGEFRRYAHMETSNPAVTVVQKEDGIYDVKTTDPTLAGTVVLATATGRDGVVDQIWVRVPP